MAEFNYIRSKLYKECLEEYPQARIEDIAVMKKYLKPTKNEVILEVGAGSGFFSGTLADLVKTLIVSDPSPDQLNEVKKLDKKNLKVICQGADHLNLAKNTADAMWSFGAMHHCLNKTQAFKNFHRILKPQGRLVIVDVFSGSKLAKHFDIQVTKYCATGHEVAFWTNEFAESLCYLTGFNKPQIVSLNVHWRFDSKKDIGIFLYKIHAMTKTTPNECLKGAEKILGISKHKNQYWLNWPLKVIITSKLKKLNNKSKLFRFT